MIRLMECFSALLVWGYAFLFFLMIHTFLPLRKRPLLYLPVAVLFPMLADAVIYSNDPYGLIGVTAGFTGYLCAFHRGRMIERLTAVLVFCPALIAINYLMQDIGSRLFFSLSGASADGPGGGNLFLSTAIRTVSLLLRLLFWLAAWFIMKRYLRQITHHLTTRMWLIVDALMLAPFVAIVTIIYTMPENPAIIYPICLTSVFSSFGCICLISYICNFIQTAYHAQELEQKQAYYADRIRDEERVRSIYHDLKNHLLVLSAQANAAEVRTSVENLTRQITDYENYHHTGNEYADIILRDKARLAQRKQIDFHAAVCFEEGGFVEPLDISTILGNALDNAIEACEKLPKDERLITVKAGRIRDLLTISVENTAPDAPASASQRGIPGAGLFTQDVSHRGTKKQATSRQDPFLHGFGLPNIQKAVGRYGGWCRTSQKDGLFTFKVILPVPDTSQVPRASASPGQNTGEDCPYPSCASASHSFSRS